MPPYQSSVFGISNPVLIHYISRTAYLLWADLSREVHVIPVVRSQARGSKYRAPAREKMDVLAKRVPHHLTTKVKRWVGPFDWVIRTPGVLPLLVEAWSPLGEAIRAATRNGRTPQIYGMNQEEFAEAWLEA
jgi:hypothetical protein